MIYKNTTNLLSKYKWNLPYFICIFFVLFTIGKLIVQLNILSNSAFNQFGSYNILYATSLLLCSTIPAIICSSWYNKWFRLYSDKFTYKNNAKNTIVNSKTYSLLFIVINVSLYVIQLFLLTLFLFNHGLIADKTLTFSTIDTSYSLPFTLAFLFLLILCLIRRRTYLLFCKSIFLFVISFFSELNQSKATHIDTLSNYYFISLDTHSLVLALLIICLLAMVALCSLLGYLISATGLSDVKCYALKYQHNIHLRKLTYLSLSFLGLIFGLSL